MSAASDANQAVDRSAPVYRCFCGREEFRAYARQGFRGAGVHGLPGLAADLGVELRMRLSGSEVLHLELRPRPREINWRERLRRLAGLLLGGETGRSGESSLSSEAWSERYREAAKLGGGRLELSLEGAVWGPDLLELRAPDARILLQALDENRLHAALYREEWLVFSGALRAG